MSVAAETRGLAEPFTGITADGEVERGLFAVRSTGVSTQPVVAAASAFLATLTPEQRAKTLFPVGDDEWRKWMNQHFYVRQGVSFLEMSEPQREAAFALMGASLSAKGLQQTRDIMRLNHTLGELAGNNFDEYGEWLYHVTVMGEPSGTEPWGWQLDGHHAIVNYFVLGDQVVMTPFFAGSEPVVARSGKYRGTAILQEEQKQGLAFVNALDEAKRGKAILRFSKTGNDALTEAWKDNVVLDYAGIRATELSDVEREKLLGLIAHYVENMDDGHARLKMDEVRTHLDRTWFAWIGKTDPESVFYYRIHSPVILIEFDHQRPVGIRHLVADPSVPIQDHVHTVVRTPNGNDYGKDLLRQHHEQHPHAQSSRAATDLSLFRAGSVIELTGSETEELLPMVTGFLESCHTFAEVTREHQPQAELERLWTEHRRQPHLLLRSTGSLPSRHAFLDRKPFVLLLGLSGRENLFPILTERDGHIESYAKCPGIDALRISCRLRSLRDASAAPPDCERVREIETAVASPPP